VQDELAVPKQAVILGSFNAMPDLRMLDQVLEETNTAIHEHVAEISRSI
jgi:hypothetical protein